MLEKVRAVLRLQPLVSRPVKEVIEELAAEVDRLRAEMNQVKQSYATTTHYQEN